MSAALERRSFPSGTVYYHPNGYRIAPEERDWSNRGTVQPGWAGPKRWWAVRRRFSKATVATCDTLREAREWCDANPTEPSQDSHTEGGERA
jgi:hypothetical protein